MQYLHPSALTSVTNGHELALASDQTQNASASFLQATAVQPDVTAKALRAVSDIVMSRFYIPPAMLAKILALADPVATISKTMVRFEGFSSCCSTYARLDMTDDALTVSKRSPGTTNVDFGAELRGALAAVRKSSHLGLSVGASGVGIETDRSSHFERKVPLPRRWIKGFAEVQLAMLQMQPAFSLTRIGAQRFMRSLPRGKADHQQWLTCQRDMVRISARQTPGAIFLRGSQRLKVLEPMLPLAENLTVHANPNTGSTSWMLDFGSQRLTLVLNAEPWRGFSGDGGHLQALATSDGTGVSALTAQLNWQEHIDIAAMTATTGLDDDQVNRALAELAAVGRVGFDVHSGSFFHRELPFDLSSIDRLNPRLVAAQKLFDAGAVTVDDTGADVKSTDVIHRVSFTDTGHRCTCPWHAKNGNERGPCKHILATTLMQEGLQ